MFFALPQESQDRIRSVARENDEQISEWEEGYWVNIPGVLDAMWEEVERVFPNAQMIWGLDYPTKEQIESYGPGLVHFDESYMTNLGRTMDGLVFMYNPEEGAEPRVPPEMFKKVDPNDPRTWEAAMWGWDPEEDD